MKNIKHLLILLTATLFLNSCGLIRGVGNTVGRTLNSVTRIIR